MDQNEMNDMAARAAEAARLFEERIQGADPGPPPPDAEAATAEMVAGEIGVKPETIDLPPQVVRGVLIYELEDGSFGSQPIEGSAGVSLDDAVMLATRFVNRAQAQLVAAEVAREMRRTMAAVKQVQSIAGNPMAGAVARAVRGIRRNQ